MLAIHAVDANRAGQLTDLRLAQSQFAEAFDETRAFGLRADQSDISKAILLQSFGSNAEIERMAVAHDQQPGIVGQAGDLALGRVADLDFHAGRHMRGKLVGSRIDPADFAGQGRQHLYDRLADMAGAEQGHGEQIRPLRLEQQGHGAAAALPHRGPERKFA